MTVSLADFGVTGSGSDERTALQSALDSGEHLLFPPEMTVYCDGPLTMNTPGQRLYSGLGTPTPQPAARLVFTHQGDDGLKIGAQGIGLYGIDFRGSEEGESVQSLVSAWRGAGQPADIDMSVIGCKFSYAQHGLKINGRGLVFQNNVVSALDDAVVLDSPSDIPTPTAYWNTVSGGSRKYLIEGNQFHSLGRAFVTNIGANRAVLHGVQVVGNHGDGLESLYLGWLNDGMVQGNNAYRCTGDVIDLFGGKDYLVSDNVISGDHDDTSTFTLHRFSDGIVLRTGGDSSARHVGALIANNVLSYGKRSGLKVQALCFAVSFTGNVMRNVCMDGGVAPVSIEVGASINGFLCRDNQFRAPTGVTGIPAFAKNSGTVTAFSIGDNLSTNIASLPQSVGF